MARSGQGLAGSSNVSHKVRQLTWVMWIGRDLYVMWIGRNLYQLLVGSGIVRRNHLVDCWVSGMGSSFILNCWCPFYKLLN